MNQRKRKSLESSHPKKKQSNVVKKAKKQETTAAVLKCNCIRRSNVIFERDFDDDDDEDEEDIQTCLSVWNCGLQNYELSKKHKADHDWTAIEKAKTVSEIIFNAIPDNYEPPSDGPLKKEPFFIHFQGKS